MGETNVVGELAQWLDVGRHHPFGMPRTTFYWLAAKQWFFLLLERLSDELPEAVLPLAGRVAKEATEPDTPHVLIMKFAKRTALRLARCKARPYGPKQLRAIRSSLLPTKRRHKGARVVTAPGHDDYRSASGERFHFDSTDTLPYWYSGAGEVFAMNGRDFCKAAERWICDEWGFTGDVRDSDPTWKWDNRQYEWSLWSHSHGSESTIESLHTHLELNAMFCVAGELIKTMPVARSRWEKMPWENWFDRWGSTWQDGWRADYRQRTPLETAFWRWTTTQGDEWANRPADNEFDIATGLANPLHQGYLVAMADVTRYQYGDYETIRIASALVPAETSQSLLHALGQSRHHHDYRLPLEDDELKINEVLADGTRLCLNGWVHESGSDSEAVDQHDPLRYGLGDAILAPGRSMRRWATLTFNADRSKSYRRGSGSSVTLFEHWNDCLCDDRRGGFQTHGRRLWVNREQLLAFLQSGGWHLIIECVITRQPKRDAYRRSEDGYDPQAKLYLVHADGTIETVKGRSCVRAASGSGDETE